MPEDILEIGPTLAVPRYRRRRFLSALARIARTVARRLEKRRTRRRLAGLDARMLRDIGLTAGEATREIRRSFPLHGRDAVRHPEPWC